MTTLDGCPITTIEQEGDYAGEDLGRIWIQSAAHVWAWYGNFATEARRQECLEQAQRMTAVAFDTWFETAP